ncbi:MAG: aspartyl/asparaginyl beta-hydroxylase domain-containing protein [Halioglobus sp.]
MDISEAQKCLGNVDIDELKATILAQEDSAWNEQRARQQNYDVHSDTESIVMLFCDEKWPNGDIHREPGWERLAGVAIPVIEHIIDTHYAPGGTLLRAMAAKLKVGGRIQPHRDALRSFHMGHRIHVPITTNASVRFMIEGRPYAFEVGKAYELNNQKKHSVMNMGSEDRISFIFDYVPAGTDTST